MFTKYLNQFSKAEAEWVQEVLDMHNGDESAAREAVLTAVRSIIAKSGETALTDFEKTIDCCCFASRNWWTVGLQRLQELGRYKPLVDSGRLR